MIVFDLECLTAGHRFEGWFGSSEDFDAQIAEGLLTCPQCGSGDLAKAPMAPNVGRKGNQLSLQSPQASATKPVAGGALPPEAAKLIEALRELQVQALENSQWVGKGFAEQSRAMHYGEREAETIHGEATVQEAHELLEEGISVMPLPFPVTPPDELN